MLLRMPFAFPSHPGLIAPLWRRWPQYFDMPAMCVGAAMPDVVDGLFGLYRGHLGQTWGHTLLGMIFLCIPLGVPLWFGLHRFARAVPRAKGTGFWARAWNMGNNAITATPGPAAFRKIWPLVLWSLLVGTFSHLLFDLLSHGEKHAGFKWFRPWHVELSLFPAWWDHTWFKMPIPGYGDGYNFAPHFIVWCLLGVIGAWMLFAPAFKKKG
jgi:hypothetical protein